MSAQASIGSGNARTRTHGLERSLPLTRLPGMILDGERDDDVALLEGLPLDRFSPAIVEQVLQPASDSMVEAVVDDLDGWFTTSIRGGALERNIRAAVQDAIEQFGAAVARGRPVLDRTLFREFGRKHARSGLPLEDLTGLFTRGGLACWRTVLGLHRSGDLPDELLEPSSEVVFVFAQELCASAVEGYVEAVSTAGVAVRSQRVELVRRLLDEEPPERAAAAAQARAVGWELPDWLAVAVTSPDTRLTGATTWPEEMLGSPHGARWCLLLPAQETEVVTPALPDGVRLAVGPAVAWDEAHRSLAVAEDLLSLATTGVITADGVVRATDHAPELVIARDPVIAEDLVGRLLGPLLDLPEQRRCAMLETLAAWVVQPGHHTALAEQLHISVRTVRYRVDRLRELLGGVVDDPDQRLALGLAVRALECVEPIKVIVLDDADAPVGAGSD